jgi:prevent-host-death family protein
MHRTQDTVPLSQFRQNTAEHVKRVAEGAIETITQNGYAAMIVMSPEHYDFLVQAAERGHVWKAALDRLEAGDTGRDAREVVRELEDEFDVPRCSRS